MSKENKFTGDHVVETTTLASSSKKRKYDEHDSALLLLCSVSPCGMLKPAPYFYYTDHSKEVDKDPLSPIIPLGRRIHLPAKMHVILDRPDLAHIVSWRPHGRSWKIHKYDEFASIVMPQYWGRCTVASFIRIASTWGFLRLAKGVDKDSYYHEYFLRGMPHLCKKMQRSEKKAVNTNVRSAKRKYEPELYEISKEHPLDPHETDAHHMDILKSVLQDDPNARMAFGNEKHVTEQNIMASNNDADQSVVRDSGGQGELLVSSLQQQPTQQSTPPLQLLQPPPPHSTSVVRDSGGQGEILLPPLQQQPTQQSTPPLQSLQPSPPHSTSLLQQQQYEETSSQLGIMNVLQRQQALSRWHGYFLHLILKGVGNANCWTLFTNWILQTGSAPLLSDEEEQLEYQRIPEQERLNARADVLGTSASAARELSPDEQRNESHLLRNEVSKLPFSLKMELMEANLKCEKSIDNNWLMLFLWAENFDRTAAAKRMAKYWKLMVGNLGRERAFLPFTIGNAFLDEHIYTLKIGYARILPVTDIHGRRIVFVEPGRSHGKVFSTDILARSFLYVLHATLEWPGMGKNGVVFIVDHKTAIPRHVNATNAQKLCHLFDCIPIRIKALHFCRFQNNFERDEMPVVKYFMSPFNRLRLEVHREEGEQLLEKFRQFGLPPESLPTELGGTIQLNHEKWVDDRLANGM